MPERSELGERLEAVLSAIYAAFSEGWSDPAGIEARRRNLAEEGIWLGRLVVSLMPEEPEALGLLALMLHAEARRGARRSASGDYIPLAEQDPAGWDQRLIDEAEALLFRASAMGAVGRFQLEAAVQSAHVERRVTGTTNWDAIERLYDALFALTGSPVVAINRAVAIAETRGPRPGLAELDALAGDQRLAEYQPYWAARARLLSRRVINRPPRRPFSLRSGWNPIPPSAASCRNAATARPRIAALPHLPRANLCAAPPLCEPLAGWRPIRGTQKLAQDAESAEGLRRAPPLASTRQEVIGQRSIRIARGDSGAVREAQRMIAEKVSVATTASLAAAYAWPLGFGVAAERAAADQRQPAVAGLSGGGFLVVWASNHAGGADDIFGQRYTATGAKQGGQFRINTFTASNQTAPAVAALLNNAFVVVWASDTQDGSGNGVVGQRYLASGAKQGPEFRVNTFTLGSQSAPAVSRFGTGSAFVVAWSSAQQDGEGNGVYAQRYSGTGVKTGGEFRVNALTAGSQRDAAIARLQNGSFVSRSHPRRFREMSCCNASRPRERSSDPTSARTPTSTVTRTAHR